MIQIKTAKEIEAMRLACEISAGALRAAGEAVRPGVSTAQIDKIVYDYIVQRGAKPNFKGLYGFPGSACISVNDTVIHGLPSKHIVLKEGDIVSVDTGAAIGGWNGDNAATFACGAVAGNAQHIMDVTKEALARGIAAAQPGNRVGDIGAAVQQYVEANGLSVVRTFVGHGVGRKLHEDPEVPNFGKPGHGLRLREGLCIAVEPMITAGDYRVYIAEDNWAFLTRDHSLSAHYENTLAITESGEALILTMPDGFDGEDV